MTTKADKVEIQVKKKALAVEFKRAEASLKMARTHYAEGLELYKKGYKEYKKMGGQLKETMDVLTSATKYMDGLQKLIEKS